MNHPLITRISMGLGVYPKRISVILPVYNAAEHLSKCVDSIIAQTFSKFEVIAINDCSTDASYDILKQYEEKYPNFKVINNITNRGAGASRNHAIREARGKYITFVDSDDWLSENYLSLLYDEAERTKAEIVFSNMVSVQNGKPTRFNEFYDLKSKYHNSDSPLDDFASAWPYTAPWMKLFRTNFIVKNRLKFLEGIRLGAEDIPFSWTAYFVVARISFCENAIYHYNHIPDSLDRAINANILEIFDALNFTRKEYERFDPDKARYSQLATMYISHIYYQFTKLVNSATNATMPLAESYWKMAHDFLSSVNSCHVEENKYLAARKKDFFFDVQKHSCLDAEIRQKYFQQAPS